MREVAFDALAVMLAGMFAAACGSNGDAVAAGGDGGACATIAPLEPCATCMKAKCSAQSAAALGAGWASGSFGGACVALLQCQCNCGTSRGCVDACDSAMTSACRGAQQQVETCRASQCGDSCAAPPDAGAGG